MLTKKHKEMIDVVAAGSGFQGSALVNLDLVQSSFQTSLDLTIPNETLYRLTNVLE